MKRQKHKNDTKANDHWARWKRGKGNRWGSFNHSDWTIEGKMKKGKALEKVLDRETNV